MDRTDADRARQPHVSSLFAPVNTVGLNIRSQDPGYPGHQGYLSHEGEERRQQSSGSASMSASKDDVSSSNPNTPLATPPAAGPGPGDSRQIPTSAATAEGLLPPRRKRNRPAKSCLQCRQRKIKCDQQHPCGSCLRSKYDNCAYTQRFDRSAWPPPGLSPASSPAPQVAPGPHQQQHHQQQPLPVPGAHHGPQYQQPQQHHSSSQTTFGNGYRADSNVDSSHHAYSRSPGTGAAASVPTPATYPSPSSIVNSNANPHGQGTGPDVVSRLEGIIQQLQQQLAQQRKGGDSLGGDHTVVGHVAGQLGESATSSVRGVLSKSRYFGQSHCLNSIKFVSLVLSSYYIFHLPRLRMNLDGILADICLVPTDHRRG